MATRPPGVFRRSLPRPFSFRCALHAFWFAALALVIFAAGCASPGEPTARKPPIPEPVANLAASQSGNAVLLAFAVPQNSVGGTPLEHPPTVLIYRDFEPAVVAGESHPVAVKHPTLLTTIPSELVPRYTARGQFRYSDQLDAADFTDHPDTTVVYSIRTRVSAKKLSAISNLAALRIYRAPEPISNLAGKVTPTAVVLGWTPPQQPAVGAIPPIAGYRIYRAEAPQESATPSSGANAAASGPAPASSASSATALPGIPPTLPALQTPLVKIGESASTTFSDEHVEFGKTYLYSVRSLVDYSDVTIESSDSNFLAITPRDTFPPAAPTGLIGIFEPAAGNVPAHVDLSWAVSPESDLAGYRIYRSEQAGVLGTPVSSELLPTPAFRDMNVGSGRRYFYAVTAVDRSDNESTPSAAVSVTVPALTQPSHD